MMLFRASLAALLAAAVSGCVVPVEEPVYSTCRATSGGDWKASIVRVPRFRGGDLKQPMLVVSGTVNVPESVDVSFALGPVEKLDTRVQQVLVRTDGAAAPGEALVTRAVSARLKPLKKFDTVRIRCGDGMFALIRDVPDTTPTSG